ncbi:MAG: xylulose kinase, partial [Candidatus Caldatribacterium sp.]|nr:xylulose kinase [Candidatus Caldatribacterium sp.]
EVEKKVSPPSGLVFLPHLRGRNCPTQPYLRGVFAGFSWDHTREHLFLAILEGIAFEYAFYLKVLRELMPEVSFSEVRVIGGGAKSAFWNRLKASILGVPYVTLNREEFSIWGSAMVAGFAEGLFPDLQEKAFASVSKVSVFEPDEKLHQRYQEFLPFYLETMEKMNEVMTRFRTLIR